MLNPLRTMTLQIETGEIADRASAVLEVRRELERSISFLDPSSCACVLAFASSRIARDVFAHELENVLGIEGAGCPNVVGVSTSGEIGVEGYLEGSISLVAFPKTDFDAETLLIDVEAVDWSAVGKAVDRARENQARRGPQARTFAVLLIDGLSGREEAVTGTLGEYLKEIPLAGGSSGDDHGFVEAPLYFGGQVRTRAAVLALLSTNRSFEVFRTQHFRETDQKVVITEANASTRTVFEIDGERALKRYAEVLGMSEKELTDSNELALKAFAEHPLVLKVGDEYFVRTILRALPDGSLQFACAIDNGLVLTIGDRGHFAAELDQFFAGLRSRIPNMSSVLGFECIFRKIEVNGLDPVERQKVMKIYSDHGVFGFHTYGEQTGFLHVNQTLTGVAFGS